MPYIRRHMTCCGFNMGLGMVIGVDPADAEKTMEAIRAAGETPYIVGYTEAGEKGVTVC